MSKFPFMFQPLRSALYAPGDLFNGFSPSDPQSFGATYDFEIYRQYITSGAANPLDFSMGMMQALHDSSVTAALADFLQGSVNGTVGIMGGHNMNRDETPYADVANLALQLARAEFTVVSGGGPGAMEATHLGALLKNRPTELSQALFELRTVPAMPNMVDIVGKNGKSDPSRIAEAHAWLKPAYEISAREKNGGTSLAIPTWFYGHEPTTPLATHVAKYFQNSIREDGLLAICTHGVVYVEGKAGTVQEIFQDATLNYYGGPKSNRPYSPMVFFSKNDYWTTKLPVIPLIERLFGKDSDLYKNFVLVTDSLEKVVEFLLNKTSSQRPIDRFNKHLESMPGTF